MTNEVYRRDDVVDPVSAEETLLGSFARWTDDAAVGGSAAGVNR